MPVIVKFCAADVVLMHWFPNAKVATVTLKVSANAFIVMLPEVKGDVAPVIWLAAIVTSTVVADVSKSVLL